MKPGSVALLRTIVPYLVGFLILANHYSRDTIGTLQKQLMSDIPLEGTQYALINTFYFLPNIVLPFVTGVLLEKGCSTVQQFMVVSLSIACISSFVFAIGCSARSYPLLFLGRTCCGLVYEIIDMTPIIFLNRIYAKNWSFVCGIINSFLRLGSVATFLISPLLYRANGIASPMYFSAFMTILGVLAGYLAVRFEDVLYRNSSVVAPGEGEGRAGARATTDVDSGSVEVGGGVGEVKSSSISTSYNMLHRIDNSSFAIDDDDEETAAEPTSQYADGPGGVEMVVAGGRKRGIRGSAASAVEVTFWSYLSALSGLFSMQFYWYTLTGMFLYGSMVPFWFIGSKFLQEAYGLSIVSADWLMLLPEGAIVIISIPLGLFLENRRATIKLFQKLLALSISIFMVAMSYVLMAYGFRRASDASTDQSNISVVRPVVPMIMIGIAYGYSNCLFWSCITDIIQKDRLAEGTGIISSAMNILPSLMPLVVSYSNTNLISGYTSTTNAVYNLSEEGALDLLILAMTAIVSSSFCVCAAISDNLEEGSSASD